MKRFCSLHFIFYFFFSPLHVVFTQPVSPQYHYSWCKCWDTRFISNLKATSELIIQPYPSLTAKQSYPNSLSLHSCCSDNSTFCFPSCFSSTLAPSAPMCFPPHCWDKFLLAESGNCLSSLLFLLLLDLFPGYDFNIQTLALTLSLQRLFTHSGWVFYIYLKNMQKSWAHDFSPKLVIL